LFGAEKCVGKHWQVCVVQNVLTNVQVSLAVHEVPVITVAAATKQFIISI
jgi:hypothetical protein